MSSRRGEGGRDLEKGHIGKGLTISSTVDWDINQADNEQTRTINPTKLKILEEDPDNPGSYNESLCRASTRSCDGSDTTPSAPEGIQAEPGSLRTSSPVEHNSRLDDPLEDPSIDSGRPPTPTRTATWKTEPNTSLANEGDPGEWAVRHHRNNFVKSIKKRPRLMSALRRRFEGRKEGESGREESPRWERPDEENDFQVNLAELQRMRLRKLQCQLVKHVAKMKKTGKEPKKWENDLETYIKAVQDYDYMIDRCKLPRDPFLVTGERYVDSYVLHSLLGDALKGDIGDTILIDTPWESAEEPIGGTRNDVTAKSEKTQFRSRIAIASIAGSFLIGPMWLMVLHNTLYTCLVSTTVFVTVFGLILAWSLDSPKEVMSGTAAYAAVLVVFVGLGNT